jgi:hypothetical protein
VLLADLIYVIIIAALVLQQLGQMIAARRRRSAGSRLHLRLTGVFAIMALLPTGHGGGLCHIVGEHGTGSVVFRPGGPRGGQFRCRRASL